MPRSASLLLGLGWSVASCRLGYDTLGLERDRSGADGGANASGTAGLAGGASGSDQGSGGGPEALAGQGIGADSQAGADAGAGAGASGSAGAPVACAAGQVLVENDAPSPPPAVSCAYPGALVCDDFEGGQLGHWKVWASPPALGALQACLVHRGNFALWVRPEAPNTVQIQQPLVPEVTSGPVYLRTFVYVPETAVLPEWTVLYEVWDSPVSWNDKVSLDLQADGSLVVTNSSGAGQAVAYFSSGARRLPRNQWTCVELELVVHKSTGSARLFLDDAEVAATTEPTRTRGNRPFVAVSQGAVVAQGPLELYFDDFAVATQRVGCQ